jgi:uncharacterized repeat protein (TIGR03843 family)
MAPLATADALELLRHGSMDIEGRLADASNTTLRAVITLDDVNARCVYKPVRGERPLWDFPDGTLAGREVSAYLVGAATGWDPVPPTVLRDGPLGPGACQLWIETDDAIDPAFAGEVDVDGVAAPLLGFVPSRRLPKGWRRIASARDDGGRPYVLAHADDPRLARLAVFDAVINNADRKGGHVLQTGDHVYGVDHGVCFHVEPKLRTILWGFVDEPLPDDIAEVLRKLRVDLDGALGESLFEHLTVAEVVEVAARLDGLLAAGCFPAPSGEWPSVPWPPI